MKATELMIGDWVMVAECVADAHFRYYPDKIESIRDGLVGLESDGLETIIERISPIPLTAEILEKNGFWSQPNVGYVMEEHENEIIYDLLDHKLRILKNREQILNLECFDDMCVHELQHALRLCNIEKEIEL